ncbi:EAL domain-containing protein [Hungatella hathewayi]|uniref:EAL domain-containing protein n=1 Tax=Hungatella hathewayi TaxID=154046 RepID=UPI003568034E
MAEQIKMVFQPIFDETMQVFAYEGLMRFSDTSIVKVINDCKSYSDFYEIEKLTFFKALQEYKKRNYKEKLFINSFPHVHLKKDDLTEIISHHKDTLKKVVIEILEYPSLDQASIKQKKDDVRNYEVLFAIDDYGINTFENLLSIAPNYLKIDRSIISGIHEDKEKQKQLENILDIADKYSCFTIAEGIETDNELYYLKNKVNYFQGYLLGSPS